MLNVKRLKWCFSRACNACWAQNQFTDIHKNAHTISLKNSITFLIWPRHSIHLQYHQFICTMKFVINYEAQMNENRPFVCLFVCYYCINKKYGHVHANKLFAIHSALEWCLFIEITELQLLTASKCGIWLIHSILMANTFSIWNIPFSVYFGIDSLWTEMDETFCHSMWQL